MVDSAGGRFSIMPDSTLSRRLAATDVNLLQLSLGNQKWWLWSHQILFRPKKKNKDKNRNTTEIYVNLLLA